MIPLTYERWMPMFTVGNGLGYPSGNGWSCFREPMRTDHDSLHDGFGDGVAFFRGMYGPFSKVSIVDKIT